MPPCAATVCERVGNTFDRHATFRPACASRSDACMPEPPAPTITTSNFLFANAGIKVSRALAPPSRNNQPATPA